MFSDNRFGDAYSASFFANLYKPIFNDRAKWHEIDDKYHFNTIFFDQYDGDENMRNFLYDRFYDKEWALVYADNYNVIFVKNVAQNQAIIKKFQITPDNIKEKLSYLSDSDDVEDQLAAADIFNLFGRVDLSIPLYLKVVSEQPNRGKVWMVLGKTELRRGDQENSNPYLAAIYLERAVKEGWATWESYSFLALAYYRTGQIERTRAAVNEELKINPGNQDGQKWLGVLASTPSK